MLLYVIRHADPIYEPDSLTPKGVRQADALAKRLALHGLDKIFSSPMTRALQTAAPAAELLGLEIAIEHWAFECWDEFAVPQKDGGKIFSCDMPNVDYLLDDYALGDEWYNSPRLSEIDGKSGYERIARGLDDFTERLGYARDGRVYRIEKPSDERVALVCHGGLGSIILSRMLNIPCHLFWSGFSMTHTGVTILNFANNENGVTAPKCLCYSDTSHIYADRLPYQFANHINL